MVNLYQQALDKWGIESQLRLAQEECAELIAAINQYQRGRLSEVHVIEEIADVRIMMRQLTLYFGEENIKTLEEEKLKRLEKYLENK